MDGIRRSLHNNQKAIMPEKRRNSEQGNSSSGELLAIEAIRTARHHKNGKVSKSKSFMTL